MVYNQVIRGRSSQKRIFKLKKKIVKFKQYFFCVPNHSSKLVSHPVHAPRWSLPNGSSPAGVGSAGGMLRCLKPGSRAPIYLPSSDSTLITPRTDDRDASPPPPPRPPLPAAAGPHEPDMSRVSVEMPTRSWDRSDTCLLHLFP